MSLLTQKQIEEIQKFHDDIGECTFPHEECFIKELIEWNEKQTFQSEQEPNNVGYLYKQKDCYGAIETVFSFDKPYITWHNVADVTPVYIAPSKREPLSREQYMTCFIDTYRSDNPITDFVKAIEKAHGIGETK